MRTMFRAALACVGLALFASAAVAQHYPTRPITFIVPWAAGSGTDLVLRAMSEAASKELGQPIIVENKSGGGGTVGPATMAAISKGDGYTIGQIPIGVFRYPLVQGSTYDAVKDFTYIANLSGYVITAQAGTSTGFKNWKDVIEYAKANPGKVTYATAGANTSGHIYMEVMAAKAGVKFTHVPFKSNAEANLAAVGGHTMLSISGLESKPMVEAGKLVFLNIWTATRNPKIPDVPTLKELGYQYVFETPWGIAGPKGMDPKIVEKIQNAYKKALDDPAVIALMDRYEMLRDRFMDSAEYTKFVAGLMVSEKENLGQLGLLKKD